MSRYDDKIKEFAEDIRNELEDNNYDIEKIPQEMIDELLYKFEEDLGDYGSECGWQDIINNVIDLYEEDLKKYKIEEKCGDEEELDNDDKYAMGSRVINFLTDCAEERNVKLNSSDLNDIICIMLNEFVYTTPNSIDNLIWQLEKFRGK